MSSSLADKFFLEYKLSRTLQPSLLQEDIKRWESYESKIYGMTLKEQSGAGDYVTQKICESKDEDVLEFVDPGMFEIERDHVVCQIGNCAMVLLRLQKISSQKKNVEAWTKKFKDSLSKWK